MLIQHLFKVVKNKKNESANKLRTSILITKNDNVSMPTNMTIFKFPEYSCIRICNVDGAKVIDWICTCSKTRNKNTPHKNEK